MKKLMAVFAALLLATGALASEKRGGAGEAKAMVERAVAFAKEAGRERALAAFNEPAGNFVDGELYIFAYDMGGVNLALPVNHRMVGKNLWEMRDPEGRYIVRDLTALAGKGGGWYDYSFTNPATKKVQPKSSYVLPVDGSWFVGCGIYK